MIFFIALYSILALQEPDISNFLKAASKNGTNEYVFIKPVRCETGKLKDAYVLTPIGKVAFKQVSKDGSIGSACVKQ